MEIETIWNRWSGSGEFSGVFSVRSERGVLFEKCCGLRNRSEQLANNRDTAFGIASGTKLLTGLAVCKLIDSKKLGLTTCSGMCCPMTWGKLINALQFCTS